MRIRNVVILILILALIICTAPVFASGGKWHSEPGQGQTNTYMNECVESIDPDFQRCKESP